MHRIPASLVALALTLGAVAQEPLADGVTAFLGAGSVVAWFEKGGTVWVTDGTVQGTRDTGVPGGNYSVATDRLIVYRPSRIDRMNADGSTTVLTPPFVFDGFDDDSLEPVVWRTLIATDWGVWIEVARWSETGWAVEVAGAYGDGSPHTVQVPILRGGRLLVRWVSARPQDLLTDLLSPSWRQPWHLTDLDSTGRGPASWNGGITYPGYFYGTGSYAAITVRDRGPVERVDFPVDWDGSVEELLAGFPVIRRFENSWTTPELLTFLTSNYTPFPPPPGTCLAVLWTAPNEQVLALIDQAGTRTVRWLDRATNAWNVTSGFGTPTTIDFVGDYLGATFLAVEDTSGVSLSAYDELTHAATPIRSGLASLPRGLTPFAGEFLFVADDNVHGLELWASDGTASGTRMVADLRSGSSSTPREFAQLGDRLLFAADSAAGMRVWSIEPQHLDWRRNPDNGHFYRLTAPASWPVARTEARNAGGELATVRDAGEQAWLNDTFGPGNLWIGLADHQQTGTFTWTSGEPLGFTAWCPNQPDQGAGETVAHITDYPGYCVGGWNDQDANDRFPGIVERREPPRPVEEFGAGCSPYFPQPIASARWAGGWPRPGGTVDLELAVGTGYYMVAAMLLGVDASSFGQSLLPFELGVLGAPGCFLHVRPDDAIVLLGPFSPPVWTIPVSLRIPNLIALRGATIFVQGFAFECSGCPHLQSFRTTNGLRITIGA